MVTDARLICPAATLVDGGTGFRFVVSYAGRDEPAFVVRFSGRVFAYLNRCGHVPIELDWQHNEFFDNSKLYLICSTHGALYAPQSGHCLGGRCNGRGLIPLCVEERDGAVYYYPTE